MPRIGLTGQPLAEVRDRPGCVLEGGTIDAMAEQLVAGCDDVGDVLVICGTTLIVWAVIPDPVDVARHYTIPHTAPGKFLVGGPSNAGGLFLNWVDRLCAKAAEGEVNLPARVVDPGRVPVCAPYPRGERVPFQDSTRRAQLVDLDLTHDGASIRRAAFLARLAAGLETSTNEAARWARTSHVVDPDPAWATAVTDRYARFCEIAG